MKHPLVVSLLFGMLLSMAAGCGEDGHTSTSGSQTQDAKQDGARKAKGPKRQGDLADDSRNETSARMAVEFDQLRATIEYFAEELGGGRFPPCSGSGKAFLRRAYPNWDGTTGWDTRYDNLTPDTALYLWLAGPGGRGFSSDPTNPFNRDEAIPPRDFFFDFDAKRMKNMKYYPPNGLKNSEPYLYTTGEVYGNINGSTTASQPRFGHASHRTFRLQCPGLDGKHGSPTSFDSNEVSTVDDDVTAGTGYDLQAPWGG